METPLSASLRRIRKPLAQLPALDVRHLGPARLDVAVARQVDVLDTPRAKGLADPRRHQRRKQQHRFPRRVGVAEQRGEPRVPQRLGQVHLEAVVKGPVRRPQANSLRPPRRTNGGGPHEGQLLELLEPRCQAAIGSHVPYNGMSHKLGHR